MRLQHHKPYGNLPGGNHSESAIQRELGRRCLYLWFQRQPASGSVESSGNRQQLDDSVFKFAVQSGLGHERDLAQYFLMCRVPALLSSLSQNIRESVKYGRYEIHYVRYSFQ